MAKMRYVCPSCAGAGEVEVVTPHDCWGTGCEHRDEARLEPCPACRKRGRPSFVEVTFADPVVDASGSTIRPIAADLWLEERKACGPEGHLEHGKACFHEAARPDEEKE
jgi:hypothetical protein